VAPTQGLVFPEIDPAGHGKVEGVTFNAGEYELAQDPFKALTMILPPVKLVAKLVSILFVSVPAEMVTPAGSTHSYDVALETGGTL
jgi:hypothetical protein